MAFGVVAVSAEGDAGANIKSNWNKGPEKRQTIEHEVSWNKEDS